MNFVEATITKILLKENKIGRELTRSEIVKFSVSETAKRLKPIKHKNPPRDKFDEGADAARAQVIFECDNLIQQAES